MKTKAKSAAARLVSPPTPTTGRQLRQRWREAWDSMSLSGQLKIAVVAAVALAIVVVQLAVASYDIVASYIQSRTPGPGLDCSFRRREPGSTILAACRRNRRVAATLQLPTGEVLWTFDRNAPDLNEVVSFDPAAPLAESRVAWYERNRLDSDLRQKLTFVAQPVPLDASLPAQLGVLVATPSHGVAHAISCWRRSYWRSAGRWRCSRPAVSYDRSSNRSRNSRRPLTSKARRNGLRQRPVGAATS
jgi:hypothetical protein